MKRCMGLETEVALMPDSHNRKHREAVIKDIFEDRTYSVAIVDGADHKRNLLKNGTQLYIDFIPSCYLRKTHLEAAMPECSNARDIALYDSAVSKILMESSIRHGGQIFKNNAAYKIQDDESQNGGLNRGYNTYGCHENYEMFKGAAESSEADALNYIKERTIPFLATRYIYTGSGHVDCGRYFISQRACFIGKVQGTTISVNNVPLVHTKESPLSYQCMRLHLVCGDSNMSDFTTYLKAGTTAIVLEMVEHGFLEPKNLEDPIGVLHGINEFGPSFKFVDSGGRKATAIDVQKWYLDMANEFYSKYPEFLDPITSDIMQKWDFTLTQLREDYMSLQFHIDWIIKKTILEQSRLKPSDSRIKTIDFQYHLLRPEGLYYACFDRLEHVLSEDEILHGMKNPPRDTRAFGRNKSAEEILKAGEVLKKFNWFMIRHLSEGREIYTCFPYSLDPSADISNWRFERLREDEEIFLKYPPNFKIDQEFMGLLGLKVN